MKTSIQAAALALATLVCAHAGATTYYVADCQSGAVAGCVPGNDANDGKSPAKPWRTTAAVAAAMGNLLAGDHVRFARGGSFTLASTLYVYNRNSRAATPIVFEAYTPAWATGKTAPILTAASGNDGFSFTDSGNADHDEGYKVRDLDLRGLAGSGSGIFVFNDVDHVTLDNLSVSGFEIGMNCAASNPANPGSDGANDHITLRNSRIHDNGVQGYYNGGCGHVLVEDNQFTNNGFAGPLLSRNHNVYIGDAGHDVTVRGNTLTRSAVGAGLCQGVALVAHGQQKHLVIEGNVIDETAGAGDGCYGIQVTPGYGGEAETFAGTIIRGNTVINAGANGIAVGACPDCVIENNRIIQMAKRTFFAITMPSENIEVGLDAADTHLTVRNNTIYVAQGTADSVGVRVGTYGQQHVVVSNLVYFGPASVKPACVANPGLTLARFTALDYNLCFSAGTGVYSPDYATLALAQAAGFDLHGVGADPLFLAVPSAANGWSLALDPASPTIGAGDPVHSVVTTDPNIGAYPWQAPAPH